jgi:fructoselysine-6-P-deglycase FrlB-like protein
VRAAPERLAGLLDAYGGDPDLLAGVPSARRVLFLGMGSSHFAALPAVALLRARGVDAHAELASSGLPSAPLSGSLVVGVSASGGTAETVEALARHRGTAVTVAVTNEPEAALAQEADVVLPLHAGREEGGVACLTFQATLAVLQLLAGRLTRSGPAPGDLRPAVDAAAALRSGADGWLPQVAGLVSAAHTTYAIAPAERLSSALQSALMLREGPRRPADATETGDWLHVDVYLTKRPGYTALLFPGSRFDPGVMEWAGTRGATVVAVGRAVEGAALAVPIPGADEPVTALLVETGVAELVAAELWRAGVEAGDPALGPAG